MRSLCDSSFRLGIAREMIRNQVWDKSAWLERVVGWSDRMSTLIRERRAPLLIISLLTCPMELVKVSPFESCRVLLTILDTAAIRPTSPQSFSHRCLPPYPPYRRYKRNVQRVLGDIHARYSLRTILLHVSVSHVLFPSCAQV